MNWEYHKEATTGGALPVEKLNALGKEGWEHYNTVGNIYFFKRESLSTGTNGDLAHDMEVAKVELAQKYSKPTKKK